MKDFDKIILVSLKMSFYYQLSYSVNKVQSEVAVRVGEAGALEPKHAAHERVFRRKRLMKVEMQFLPCFFLLWQKSKNNNNYKLKLK